MKNTLLLFCLVCITKQFSAQNSADQTWVIISYIKESSKNDYEKWMTDIFFAPMQSSQDPVLKKQFSTARWQKPVRQNADKTWTYGILLDPATPNADYGIESFLVKTYGEAKGKNYAKQYEDFMASAGQIHFFERSEGLTTPSVNSDEEAIKAVIEGENAAFNAGDIEKTRSFFNFQPYNIGVLTTQNGVTYVEAGEKFNNFYKNFKASKITATHDNYNIRITGNTAWETNDQTQFEDNKILLTSHQMRCLEKVNGAWKIVTFSAHHSKPQTETPPSVKSEEEAVKKVIIDEMDAFLTSNLEAWANAQMQTPYHSTLHKLANVSSAVGWDKKYENAKKGFGTPNDIAYKKSYLKANRTDWNIQIRGNVAWARWKDTWDMTNGSVLPMYNLKILEKQNSQWRISHAGVYTAPEETFNQAKEEEAIKKVIIEEGRDFGRGNLEAFMGAYANVPHVLWTVTNLGEPGDVLTYRGYDALKSFAESMPWFKTFKPEDAQKPVSDAPRDNWQFQFRGNIAMVNFEEHWINDKTKAKVDATVIKNFEKINGQWKLITTSALADFKDATPPIRTKY